MKKILSIIEPRILRVKRIADAFIESNTNPIASELDKLLNDLGVTVEKHFNIIFSSNLMEKLCKRDSHGLVELGKGEFGSVFDSSEPGKVVKVIYKQGLEPISDTRFNRMLNSPIFQRTRLIKRESVIKNEKQSIDIRMEVLIQSCASQILDNVPKVHVLYEDLSKFYVVMDKVVGGELEFESRKIALSEKQFNNICSIVRNSVQAMHCHNIVHRDLSLNNIFYNVDTGKISIIDFGNSKFSKDPSEHKNDTDVSEIFLRALKSTMRWV